MNIYVANLSRDVTAEELKLAFEEFGQVDKANIIKDKYSGESKGFGFVEMPSKDEGKSAIDNMNGKEFQGKTLNVNEARPRTDNRGGKGGFGGGGNRGGFGGGGNKSGFGGAGKGGSRGGYGGAGKRGGGSRGGNR